MAPSVSVTIICSVLLFITFDHNVCQTASIMHTSATAPPITTTMHPTTTQATTTTARPTTRAPVATTTHSTTTTTHGPMTTTTHGTTTTTYSPMSTTTQSPMTTTTQSPMTTTHGAMTTATHGTTTTTQSPMTTTQGASTTTGLPVPPTLCTIAYNNSEFRCFKEGPSAQQVVAYNMASGVTKITVSWKVTPGLCEPAVERNQTEDRKGEYLTLDYEIDVANYVLLPYPNATDPISQNGGRVPMVSADARKPYCNQMSVYNCTVAGEPVACYLNISLQLV